MCSRGSLMVNLYSIGFMLKKEIPEENKTSNPKKIASLHNKNVKIT
jgi:hypothetical protein